MAAARRRRLRRTSIATLLLALLVLLPSAAATSLPMGEDSPDSRLTITSITPIADGEGTAQVVGELSNTTEETLVDPSVDIVTRSASASREDIATWAEGTQPVDGAPLATARLDDIAPGDSAPFALEVPAEDLAPGVTAGAAWVSIQSGRSAQSAVHTFIGVHRAKEYVPMEMVWGVPLLLPSDPRLFGEPGEERTTAWEETVGPDSRLRQLVEEPPAEDEVWILDPSLLSLPPQPTEDTEADQARAMTEERELRSEWAAALRENLDPEQTIVLPTTDADIAAATRARRIAEIVRPRITEGMATADLLDAHADVQWPAEELVTASRARALARLHPGSRKPTVLTDTSALAPGEFTPTGAARTTHGTPLLVADQSLSDLAGALGSSEDATLARQRLVAESSVLLGERPGTPRSVLVVPPRASAPDPDAYEQLRSVVEEIPWLEAGRLDGLLEQVDAAPPEAVPRTAGQIEQATEEPTPPPALTRKWASRIQQDTEAMRTFASVRADGPTWLQSVGPSLDQLASSRWRGDTDSFEELHDHLAQEVSLTPEDLVVSSGEVNFFADTGRLQITIINKTDVQLTNLHVEIDSETPAFLITSPPEPVTIGPTGRQKVTVQATALAAGRTPVHVVVTTPEGHELTAPATLKVLMRPTGETVYWVIGGIAVVLLAAGTWRSVRRRRTPGTSGDTA